MGCKGSKSKKNAYARVAQYQKESWAAERAVWRSPESLEWCVTPRGCITAATLHNLITDGFYAPYTANPHYLLVVDCRDSKSFTKHRLGIAYWQGALHTAPLPSLVSNVILYDDRPRMASPSLGEDDPLAILYHEFRRQKLDPQVVIGGWEALVATCPHLLDGGVQMECERIPCQRWFYDTIETPPTPETHLRSCEKIPATCQNNNLENIQGNHNNNQRPTNHNNNKSVSPKNHNNNQSVSTQNNCDQNNYDRITLANHQNNGDITHNNDKITIENHQNNCVPVSHNHYNKIAVQFQKRYGTREAPDTVDARPWYPALILPDLLYLGQAEMAWDPRVLTALRITHILDVTECLPPRVLPAMNYLLVPLPEEPRAGDYGVTDLETSLPTIMAFVGEAKLLGGCVLVHCDQGLTRAAAVVMGILMTERRCTLEDAFYYVKGARAAVHPDSGLLQQLVQYESVLFGTSLTAVEELF